MRDSGQPDWKCGEVAGQFELKGAYLEGPIAKLSGGWQTRVKLAALLLHVPQIRAAATRAVSGLTITVIAMLMLACLYGNPPMSTVLVRVLIAAMVASTTLAPSTIWGRFLETAPMRWIGVLSYSLYIWQQLFLAPKPVYAFHHFPVNVLLAFVAAYCSYRWVEKPLIALGRKLGRPRTQVVLPLPQSATFEGASI